MTKRQKKDLYRILLAAGLLIFVSLLPKSGLTWALYLVPYLIVGGEVLCGGVTVRSGDVVVGDCDGVVVIPQEEAEEILDKALAKKKREDEMRPLLRAGGTTAELLGLVDKLGL